MIKFDNKKLIAILILILIEINILFPIITYAEDNITTNYEIKDKEEWDVSEKRDKSIIVRWDYSDKKITISGSGKMMTITGEEAFWDKYEKYVEKIQIDEGVTSIGYNEYLFSYCDKLVELKIPSTLKVVTGFKGCSKLKEVVIPSGVEKIGSCAFQDCKSLEKVNIPNTVTTISNDSFAGCSSLESIDIPSSVTSFSGESFMNCIKLKSVNIDSLNKNYVNVDGVVYSKDKKTLIYYPANKDGSKYTLNSTVRDIKYSAFNYCQNLENIELSNNITQIDYYTFMGCSNLKSIDIPSSVTSIGNVAFKDCTNLSNITIPNKVTDIGFRAFQGCSNLTNITIPSSVTSLGYSAFEGCSSLTSITIPNTITTIEYSTFCECTSLKNIIIPNSVTSIKDYVFNDCNSLKEIYIPSSVTEIEEYAFDRLFEGLIRCETNSVAHKFAEEKELIYVLNDNVESIYSTNYRIKDIEEIKINDTVKAVWKLADRSLTISGTGEIKDIYNSSVNRNKIIEKVRIESGITSIGDSVFRWCSNLNSITIPSSVTSLGDSAFKRCSSLTSITIPSNVTSLGYSAFEGCSSLTSITIPSNVTSLGYSAFEGCSSLTSITIPSSVTSLGNGIFKGCSSLTSITIPSNVTSLGYSAFEGCSSLTSITIPSSVTSLGDEVFRGCSNLKNITVENNKEYISIDGVLYDKDKKKIIKYPPNKNGSVYSILDSVTSIEKDAFGNCSNLTNITIPNSVTKIGPNAFRECSRLTTVEIPKGITEIDVGTFENCSSLSSITFPNSLISIGYSAFIGCNSLEIIEIPKSVTKIGALFDKFNGLIKCYKNSSAHKILENEKKPYFLIDKEQNESDDSNNEITEIIEIYTSEDLWNFAKRFNNEEWSTIRQYGLKVELKNDIDLECSEENQWIPIGLISGGYTLPFYGIFEGNNHTISNMYISECTSSKYIDQGFFRNIANSGVVQNLNLKNCIVNNVLKDEDNNNEDMYGIIASSLTGKLINCKTIDCQLNISKIFGSETITEVGGLVAYASDCEINNCYNGTIINISAEANLKTEGSITSSNNVICGGIAGNTSNVNISNSINNAKIINNIGRAGGIAGNVSVGTIKYCTNNGEINSGSNKLYTQGAGGIVGEGNELTIYGCGNNANIQGINYYRENNVGVFLGGIIGKTDHNSDSILKIENCYSIGNIILNDTYTNLKSNDTAGLKVAASLGGIVGYIYRSDIVNMKNIYISGEVDNKSWAGSLVGSAYNYPKTFSSENIYKTSSLKNLGRAPQANETLTINATQKTESEMKKEEFVTLLNSGSEEFIYDNSNIHKGYPLIKNGYKEIDLLATSVKYSNTKKTNSDVTVTITANKEIQEVNGWTLSTDKKKLTKTYSKNTTEEITIKDLVGNETKEKITISNIDKTVPTLSVKYSSTEKTNSDVTVTITANEEIQEVSGWTLSTDKKKLTKTYSKNTTEEIVVKDLVGNETKEKITISNIDKTALTLSVKYSSTEKTNSDVTVTITANREIQEVSGWTLSTDKKKLTKTYSKNTTEEIVVKDLVGNEAKKKITISNIDKTALTLSVKYSSTEKTNSDVTVTITANREIQEVSGWTLSTDKKKLTKTYSKNTTEEIIVKDLVGNETKKKITISNIDKTVPTLSVKYSSTEKTNSNVTVTITANEEIQKVNGWTLSTDKKKLTKTYSKNTTEEIEVKDLVGNETKQIVTINNIIQVNADINENNKIDMGDVLILLRHIAQEKNKKISQKHPNWKLDDKKLVSGDINKNNKIDVGDILVIQRYIAASKSKNIADKHPQWLNIIK